MAYEIPLFDLGTLVAAADLSTKHNYVVDIDNTGKIALCSSAGQSVVGVLENKPGAGEIAEVGIHGVRRVIAGGAVTKGDLLKTDASGRAVTAQKAYTNTSDAGAAQDALAGSHVFARALEGASGAGEYIAVLMLHLGAVPTTAA